MNRPNRHSAKHFHTQWVALMTFMNESAGMFYEEGGIYQDKPQCNYTTGARELSADEHVVECPRCGQRFAATDNCTAEENRDLHFVGDEEIPSICLDGANGHAG